MLAGFTPATEDRPGKLSVAFFGMFGPHGPLPLHLTEYARERIRHTGDHTFAAFTDIFNHRMLVMFQRAWAVAQPAVSHDRPETDRFRSYMAAVFGHDFAARSSWPAGTGTWSKLQYAGHLASLSRNASGLESLLSHYFDLPVVIEQFIGQWLEIPEQSRFALGVSPQVSALGGPRCSAAASGAVIRNSVSCSVR